MRKKRVLIGVILMAIGMAGGILGTMAYLKSVTQTATNTFQSDKNISIQLREPTWDGYTFDDATTQNGTATKNGSTDSALGLNQAKAYVPGQVISKNPMVRNDGQEDGVDTYTAIRVQYVDNTGNEVDYATFQKEYLTTEGIRFNESWERIGSKDGTDDIYLYKPILKTGEVTPALFTQVPLSEDIAADSESGRLPSFQIKVTAYAIQSDHVDADSINSTMLAFIGGK